ncbi:ORF110 [White spot syndrome virus]|uniref:ORF110 n=1 Tax=White spot syndrome virus TaxID=342409 RepID=A0A2D3I6Q3_9VIRU|nr:ORF110 [White spot syndrome virus]
MRVKNLISTESLADDTEFSTSTVMDPLFPSLLKDVGLLAQGTCSFLHENLGSRRPLEFVTTSRMPC